jgi:chromate transporter
VSEISADQSEIPSLPAVSLREIFVAFLIIGATSFGGGVVAYLRSGLVTRYKWLTDHQFIELLSISQSLPGLNATNMAVLVGERLRGPMGATVATIAICLPGAVFMVIAGGMYKVHGDKPWIEAMLHGVAAAAVGLILATTVSLGRTSLKRISDYVFVILAIIGLQVFHLKVPFVLLGVGVLAVYWYRPRPAVVPTVEQAKP